MSGASQPPSERRESDVAHEVLHAIRAISRHVSEHSARMARDTGLTVPQLMCLKAIGDLGPSRATVATVSSRVELSPATVSRIIDRIGRDGFVNRVRSASDKRKVGLVLTQLGRDRYNELPAPLHEEFVDRLMALGGEERGHLLSSLRQLSVLMEPGTD